MIQMLEGLYLGDCLAAENLAGLHKAGITHVLNCAAEVPCFHGEKFTYLRLQLHDPDPRFADCLDELCLFIDEGRRAGGVLVHCHAGISRSPSAVLAYLCHQGNSLEAAAAHLGGLVWTYPDRLFLSLLAERHGLVWSDDLGELLYASLTNNQRGW